MTRRSPGRTLTTAALTATFALVSWATAATAAAHIRLDTDHPVRGDTALITFQVPNESVTGSPTTKVVISLPNVTAVSTDVMAGWTAVTDRDAGTGAYRSVRFTAIPDAGIGAGQFELFAISVQLPDTATATFPVVQTYADGTVVDWDQPPLPNGEEPEHPAPVLTLTAGPRAPTGGAGPTADDHSLPAAGPDNTARALAGGALLVAAIGVGVAV
ncbi:YcnI family protein, partial [Mycobacterium sp. shizuoka-1]|uniref:YcnI family copper-binding membrane protein n=1 Tax=Mycobacterium sp. shizuoka-1 TaxID=2039281 RepID=UPI000C086983